MLPVGLSNNLIYDLSLSLSDKSVSQEIPKPYLALPLYTPILQGSTLLSELSDRKHSSLIWLETGIKKGLTAGGRVSCSVYIQLGESYIYCIIIFGLYHLKLLFIKLITLFIQRKTYFILRRVDIRGRPGRRRL